MIDMENWATRAVKKLEEEKKAVAGQKEKEKAKTAQEATADLQKQLTQLGNWLTLSRVETSSGY